MLLMFTQSTGWKLFDIEWYSKNHCVLTITNGNEYKTFNVKGMNVYEQVSSLIDESRNRVMYVDGDMSINFRQLGNGDIGIEFDNGECIELCEMDKEMFDSMVVAMSLLRLD